MKADFFGYDGLRYDALLDLYESGLTVERLDPCSRVLEKMCTPDQGSSGKDEGPDLSWVTESTWSQKAQEELSQSVSEAIGFDFEAGRRDLSTTLSVGDLIPMM